MLQTSNISLGEPLSSQHLLSPVDILFRSIAIIRRHYKLCAAVPAVFLILAIVYLVVTPPQFTATTVMAIDPRKSATATPGVLTTPAATIDCSTAAAPTTIYNIVSDSSEVRYVAQEELAGKGAKRP